MTSLRLPRLTRRLSIQRRQPTALTRAVISILIGVILALTAMIVLQYFGVSVLPKPVEPGFEQFERPAR